MKNKKSCRQFVAEVLLDNQDVILRASDIYIILVGNGIKITRTNVDNAIFLLFRQGLAAKEVYKQPAWYKATEKLINEPTAHNPAYVEKVRKYRVLLLSDTQQVTYINPYDQLYGKVELIQAQHGNLYDDQMHHNLRLNHREKVYVGSTMAMI
jgi:hypothetical protein